MKKLLSAIVCVLLLTGCSVAKLSNGEDSVVTFNEGGISADDLFEVLKEKYGTTELVTLIDSELLEREYDESQEENQYIKDVIASLKEQWGDSYESNMKASYNVSSESEFKDFIRLNYRRLLWEEDYSKESVTDTEINDYYNDALIGDITASHILIKVDSEDKDEESLNLAKEIITKLNNGEDFASLAKEYSDDAANSENGGSLGKFNDRSNYDENFLEAAIALNVGEYSKTPVKSQFGYHIIYKTAQDEKPALDDVKDAIIEKIAKEKVDNDSSFMTTAILALREKYGIKITDSVLSDGYNTLYGL